MKAIKGTTGSDIEFNRLTYSAGNTPLLEGVSGRFEAARIHAILGQNGAGKTTLLRCLTRELKSAKGDIRFADRALSDWSLSELARQRAVLSQNQELVFSFTVEQLVCMGFDVQQGAIAISGHHMDSLLQACDLQALRKRDYLTLSGGEQRRAQLARVLAQIWPQDPEQLDAFSGRWLFLDEWTAGLDLKHQVRIGRLLQQWSQQGLGVVMILHDLNQVMQLADSCLLLKAGRRHSSGTTSEVMTAENLRNALEVDLALWQPPGAEAPVVMPVGARASEKP